MKKFIIYFAIFFVVTFAFLNVRFISAEFKFWLREKNIIKPAISSDIKATFPISESNYFFMEIPAIGVQAPIALEKSLNTDVIFNRLSDGTVHYALSPLPGEKGTAIILGHSSAYPWYKGKYGSVFALLNKLKVGDEILINNNEKILRYKVTSSLVFNPLSTKDQELLKLEETDNSSIILVSCWPVGTDYKRIAIKADLIN